MKKSGRKYELGVLRRLSLAVLCSAMLVFIMQTRMHSHAQAQSTPMPTRHVRQAVIKGDAVFLNRLPASDSLRLNIALPLRNESELDNLLQELYNPQSPLYGQYLTVEQFTERFGPTVEDYAAVLRFAEQNGMTVTGVTPNRMLVNVTASVANIESAFHVKMGSYQHPTEDRAFYAPDREPAVDLDVPLWHITGLDNFSIPRPKNMRRNVGHQGQVGSGPGGEYLGSDMRAAYGGGTTLTGAGQSVGVFEFLGYNIADINSYFTNAHQTRTVAVTGVSTDGSSLSCTGSCDDTEQVLDIDQAISMAPGMNECLVYVSDTSDVSIFNRMATDNIAKSLSCSWGWRPADPSSDDPIFKEFSAQGQNLFVASGDSGAYSRRSQDVYPADDAFITSVGGTDLTTVSAGGAWASETAWPDSGGGISPDNIAIPSYQTTTGVITTANKGSKTLRNAPDVAAEANFDNYVCSDGTCGGGWGGTSFAAPRWAGYLALVNQQAVANGLKTPGFINPTIYTIGLGSSYATCFHDITSGSNGTYSAQKGYDLVTGWGSPNGAGLINTLAP
jgi:subtilase family serine protease